MPQCWKWFLDCGVNSYHPCCRLRDCTHGLFYWIQKGVLYTVSQRFCPQVIMLSDMGESKERKPNVTTSDQVRTPPPLFNFCNGQESSGKVNTHSNSMVHYWVLQRRNQVLSNNLTPRLMLIKIMGLHCLSLQWYLLGPLLTDCEITLHSLLQSITYTHYVLQ